MEVYEREVYANAPPECKRQLLGNLSEQRLNLTLFIFRRDAALKYSKLQQVKTQTGARTMVVSQKDSKAYLVTSKFGQNTGATSEEIQFRPTPIPGTFSVIIVGR